MEPTRDVIVGQVRRRAWTRVAHGVYRRDSVLDHVAPDLVALQEICPPSAVITHVTAASLRDLWLPPLPADLPVFVSQSSVETRPKRAEIKVMRHTKGIRWTWLDGLRVATPDEILLTCARHVGLLDLVVLGDSALAMGATSIQELESAASRNRWGAAALRRAVKWMDRRSESPWESLLRVFHRASGVAVVPQHEVYDDEGRFVARGDLWLVGSRMLHEYDGAVHRDATTHLHDLDRDRRLHAAQWFRRGYTARDLMKHPEAILRDADLTLGRRYRADRLDPWLAMFAESLFSSPGQERFLQRLRRSDSGRELHHQRR